MTQGGGGPDGGRVLRPVEELVDELQAVTGATVDVALLRRALTHRSFAYENGGLPHNERLEFLGDSVLGLVVTDSIYNRHPDLTEGQLAKLRASVVNMRALAEVARTVGLGDFLLLGRGEVGTHGWDKDSILADTTEAVIGATYSSVGYAAAAALVHHLLDPMLRESARLGAGLDWKTSLQELLAQLGMPSAEYHLTETGPEHEKTFRAEVRFDGTVLGEGTGRTKKDAESRAAAQAWRALRDEHGDPTHTHPLPAID
jgi:ribonuclease-3